MFRGTNTGGTSWGVQEANALPNKYNGLKAKIIDIVERGRRRTGFKVFVIIGVGEVKRYQIDLDSALEYGEVVVDGYVNPNASNANNSNSSISLADEIKKLNELKESGLLTEDEYQKAKAKLIE
ncbi:MAG TPA: SHOCT domain-containing protein [Flavobacterium sp.]|nr:SHOCT domain-containing protein [Flavobacterium sp.]